MSRRHERARRDDARDPDARVIDHGRYQCVVVEYPGATWRDKLKALARGAEDDAARRDALDDEC